MPIRLPVTAPNKDIVHSPPAGIRLHHFLAAAGVASRRACEQLIREGDVRVNGRVVRTLPAWVDPEIDRVEVDGKAVATPDKLVYIMLNKPRRSLTTTQGEAGDVRKIVSDLVEHPLAARLYPVGRLDYDTMGLLLLTNDGEFANRLTHPRYGVPKTYHAVVGGSLEDDRVAEIKKGIYLANRREGRTLGAVRTGRVDVSIIKRDRDRTVLEITLREGRNREVRRLMAAVGCPVKRLERVAVGPVRLSGVPRGGWRELTREEVRSLKRATRVGGGEQSVGTGAQAGPRSLQRQKPGPGRSARPTTSSKRSTSKGRPGSKPKVAGKGPITNRRNPRTSKPSNRRSRHG
ncbi:MAG: rRNA pseudouridine synthase [Phycisphaeraceae bacterium]|nr:rRNA pseudouridine synthase [Phycisphaeraceae bacterium]